MVLRRRAFRLQLENSSYFDLSKERILSFASLNSVDRLVKITKAVIINSKYPVLLSFG